MPEQAHVLYCVQFDTQTNTCAVEAWMPAPQLLPPLSPAQAGALLTAELVLFATAWGIRQLSRTIRQ
ncbi:hypothetical protein [Luteimonas sp. RC10]|uniref:hypothetical protein n=1 Tax=Luteimonas sp. RC10 TaxID=2587035 RepID=UPI00161E7CD6|nr:hypothetical protein [Luteimonas sp. RC10]MBB3344516.1 hypothetical protein [Luteimonas sp. RC10]